jgi:hypothetical protein
VLFDAALRSNGIPADAGGAIYELVGGAMRDTAVAVLVLALVTAVVAWFAGPFDVPRRLRAVVHGGAASLRGTLDRRGLSSGRVGTWMYSRRALLRAAIIVAGAAVVLLVRPLTPALVLWTLALSLLVVLVLEVVERPSSDDDDADADAIDAVAAEDDARDEISREKAALASTDSLGRASS